MIALVFPLRHFVPVLKLTRQEQLVLTAILGLLLLGWAVKSWRLAHPPEAPSVKAHIEGHAID